MSEVHKVLWCEGAIFCKCLFEVWTRSFCQCVYVELCQYRINVKLGGINAIPDPNSVKALTDPQNPTIVMGEHFSTLS